MIEIKKMNWAFRDWMTIIFVGSESGVTELMTRVLDSRISVTVSASMGKTTLPNTPSVVLVSYGRTTAPQ